MISGRESAYRGGDPGVHPAARPHGDGLHAGHAHSQGTFRVNPTEKYLVHGDYIGWSPCFWEHTVQGLLKPCSRVTFSMRLGLALAIKE